MKDTEMNILKAGFRKKIKSFFMKTKVENNKYVKEVCDYLNIGKTEFLDMVKKCEELKGDFYQKSEAIAYICSLVYYNRIQNNRNKSWSQIIKLIKRYSLPSLLEFGCGTACLTHYLKEQGCEFKSYAYDIPSKTLGFAKWRLRDTVFLDEVTEHNRFTIVTCLSVLEHVPLGECGRIVKLLERVTDRCLIINFVKGSGIGHIRDTQQHFDEFESFLNNHFKKKKVLWCPDIFAYER